MSKSSKIGELCGPNHCDLANTALNIQVLNMDGCNKAFGTGERQRPVR